MSHVTVHCFALLSFAETKQSRAEQAKQSNKVSHVTVLCFALLCYYYYYRYYYYYYYYYHYYYR